MKERPIIFNDEMVRAILAGRKTQTRRIVNGVPSSHDFHGWVLSSTSAKDEGKACWAIGKSPLLNKPIRVRCPFGAIGDRLWVRETFNGYWLDDDVIQEINDGISSANELCDYRADYSDGMKPADGWTPSIHMPRWASRITLEITDVRVERLKSISEADARAEGVVAASGPFEAQLAFHELWRSIYGLENWNSNPWVWVIAFMRVDTGSAAGTSKGE